MEKIIFYLLSVVIIISAIGVVSLKNLMHSALSLMFCLFSTAGIFLMLNADFIAGVQVMLYVGGVTVLILFVVMLTYRLTTKEIKQTNEQVFVSLLVSGIIFAMLFILIKDTGFSAVKPIFYEGTTSSIGRLLLTKYLLPFEIASLVLLSVLIGAIVLSRKEE